MRHSSKLYFFVLCYLSIQTLLSGCQTVPAESTPRKKQNSVSPQEIIQSEKKRAHPSPPAFKEKLQPVELGLTSETKLYTMIFDNVSLGEAIAAITRDSNLNVSIESGIDINRAVTVHLNNVTFKEALNMIIVNAGGYSWNMDKGFLNIKQFQEKVYHLDYLDIIGSTDINVGGDMLGAGVEDSGVSGKYEVKSTRSSENADIWKGIRDSLEGLKSAEGTLKINRNAGIIYMLDTPNRISSMVAFLDSLSESLHRQVYIEAKILEVSLNDSNKFGIDWTNFSFSFESGSDLFPQALNLNFNEGANILLSDNFSFSAVLDFLQTQGEVTVLSNPSISVLNGQSAVMTVGFQFPFGDVGGVTESKEGHITFNTDIKRAVLGLQMGITPQISKDGVITLHIVPTITRIQGNQDVEILVSTGTRTISNPIIDLQELSTTVRVKEGQSVVLAGLISQMKKINKEGLPVANNFPILGKLFDHIEDIAEKRELVIFVTPYLKNVL